MALSLIALLRMVIVNSTTLPLPCATFPPTTVDREATLIRVGTSALPDGGASGTASVAIQIDAQGNIVSVKINKSSGNADVDSAAVNEGCTACIEPAVRSGKSVGGVYILRTQFNSE